MQKFRVVPSTGWDGKEVFIIEEMVYKGLFGKPVYVEYLRHGWKQTFLLKSAAQVECDRLNRRGFFKLGVR